LARRRKHQEKPPPSNRGRRGARGIFLIFDRKDEDEDAAVEPRVDADEPLSRDHTDDDAA
jgi:hypothetical protein